MTYIYVLKLENDCWYIGLTKNFDRRMKSHFERGGGARWTRKHKPIAVESVEEVEEGMAYTREDSKTLEYITRYGIDKVRGGTYCVSRNRRGISGKIAIACDPL